ncbi:hypothetical protein CO661_26660 [Sinorhizobium fredii]|uniref:Ribbon-helix-helix protein CopG domain-containing protein n=2 Tax=Rhizobium fredii TaxID=380 RepID=A0A2A6LQM1_RHIFR|nr:hypothetical protein [Sinorhizobium fredii]MQX09563.1 hypothetical protein [Sinorhizobium fredii]PDT44851.1 hypothetical protein CO661_26660 [Sinorhizobium fredii]UTY47359.1 hypothetical protein EPK84_00310 [Sinorhizobium fredii]
MMTFDDDVERALARASEELEMKRQELIRLIIREWLESYGFLPFHELDEGSETEGSA